MRDALRTLLPVVAAFALLMGLAWLAFGELLAWRNNPNRELRTGPGAPERIVLEPGPGGHYVVPGRINDREVSFLVDTGASHVAVPAGLADELGLARGPEIRVVTASGTATAYHTRIGRIAVGGLELRDVRGSIIPSMEGEDVLLGMTFLRAVDFRQQDGRLILQPPG